MKRTVTTVALKRLLLLIALTTTLVASALPGAAGAQAMPADQPDAPINWRVQTPVYTLDANGLRVPGYDATTTPGAPVLPVSSTLLELPATGKWTLRYESIGAGKLAVEAELPAAPVLDASLDGPVPWQERDDLPEPRPVDRPDPAIYEQAAFYPAEPVTAGPEQWQRGKRFVVVHAYPFQYNPVSGELLYHPDLRITVETDPDTSVAAPAGRLAAPPRLPEAVDGALRIYTGQRGLYRLTYTDLQSAGVPVATVDPAKFAMAYLNQPMDIEVTGAADGRFDPGDMVIFSAEPYQGRYMTRNVYRFTYGGAAAGPRMAERSVAATGTEPLVSTMAQTVRMERDVEYRSLYNLPRTADHWFDRALFANAAFPTVSVTYDVDAGAPLNVAPGNAQIRGSFHGGNSNQASPDQSLEIRLNSHVVGTYQWNDSTPYLATATVPSAWLDSTPNRVTLTAALSQLPGLTFYWISPDWVEITLPAYTRAQSDRLYVEGISVSGQRARVRVPGFSSGDVRVYDVRDPHHPVRLTTTQTTAAGGQSTVDFWDQWPAGGSSSSYYLTAAAALLQPLAVEPDAASNWTSPQHSGDYIAVVHASLWNAIDPLLARRAAEGLRVVKVDVQDIYDEVSGGRVDPEAIRTFLAYAYHNWNAGGQPPRYVLLVGDGHYDFKNAANTNLPNLIPPYLLHVDPYLGETATDNRYVSVDGHDDFLPDMHVGRIPAKTAAHVTAVLDKITAYETAPAGGWQSKTVFVADDYADPAGNFHLISEDVRVNWLPAGYDSQRIYYRMDANHDTAAKMRIAIKTALNQGAIYLQWFGHASQFRWGYSVDMWNIRDPETLAPTAQLPFTVHYTCWSGYFIGIQGSPLYNRNEQSLGEVSLLTAGRGSIADLSPSGLHIGSALLNLDRGIVKAIFQDGVHRVGDAVDAGRLYFYANSTSFYDLIDTSILFGDPALRLRVPGAMSRQYLPVLQVR